VLEKYIEIKFCKAIKEQGGIALKLTSPAFNGLPDRIVLMPGGQVWFAELKAPGRKPRKRQDVVHKMLRDLGFEVRVIDS